MSDTKLIFKKLVCGQPNSSIESEFPFLDATNETFDHYETQGEHSSPQMLGKQSGGPQMLGKQSGESFLHYRPFVGLLGQCLLEYAAPLWCKVYAEWKEMRPNEVLTLILRGMVKAVWKLHRYGEYHGGLYDQRNYVIRFTPSYVGEEFTAVVEVELLYEYGDFSRGDRLVKMKQDMKDFFKLVFDGFLKLEGSAYPGDWEHFRNLVAGSTSDGVTEEMYSENLAEIQNHPVLWPSMSRRHFYGKAFKDYIDTKGKPLTKLKNALNNCDAAKNWHSKIIPGTPFDTMLKNPPDGNAYKDNGVDCLRFVRNVGLHIKDKKKDGSRIYFNEEKEPQFLNDLYVELQLRVTFPLLMVEFYSLMWSSGNPL